jgi:hypothetical protein
MMNDDDVDQYAPMVNNFKSLWTKLTFGVDGSNRNHV